MGNDSYNSWDQNVPYRIKELETYSDKTYWELLVPLFVNDIKSIALNKNVIDIGCGLGFLTNEISLHVEKITGIDTSIKSIEYAKKHFNKKNLNFYNVAITEFQDKYHIKNYDICTANMVFHNIQNLDENINAISKFLNKNGYLIFSIPHPAFWYISRKFNKLFKSFSYKYFLEKKYLVPFKIKNHKKHPNLINYYHRSLEKYSELLHKYNFVIKIINEPFLDLKTKNKKNERDILYYICQLQ